MRKIEIFGVAFAAVFAFAALVASVASAETTLLAEWLNNGKPVVSLLSTEASGEVLFEDTSNKGGVVCSGILDGSVGADGEDEITSVLSLAGVAVTLGAPILCKAATGSACSESATDIEFAPENLPWSTLLFLMENGSYQDLISGAAYSVSCLVIIKITDECSEEMGTLEVKNAAGGVTAVGAVAPLSKCSIGGPETGLIEALAGNLLTLNAPNGPLSVSAPEMTLSAEWLNNGKPILSLLSTEATGEVLLEDTSNKGGVVCSSIVDGSVGPNGEDEITAMLTLAGVAVTLTAPILCKAAAGSACAESTTDIEFAPENLPWNTLLFLKENGSYQDLVASAAYSVTCLVIIKITDECSEEMGVQEVENAAGGVTAVGAVAPLSKCSIGGPGTYLIEQLAGNLLTLNAPNGPLSVSSEP